MTRVFAVTRLAAVIALAIALAGTGVAASEAEDEIVLGSKFSIESAVLQETREYLVYVPARYEDRLFAQVRYPVMYVLDGEDHFTSAAALVDFMSEVNSQIPQQIVVAIINTDRARDLTPTSSNVDMTGRAHAEFATTGGGDRFLEFLEHELIPRIEADYRTAPYRTFVGHSFGGLTVLHSLLTQPGLFRGYIALDPSLWWQDQLIVKRVREKPVDVPGLGARVFLALADHRTTGQSDGSTMIVGNMRFAELLQGQQQQNLSVTLQHFSGEGHGTVPLPALYHGLQYVFDDYELGDEFALENTTAKLIAHFKAISAQFGFEVLPPEPLVDQFSQVAYGFLNDAGLAMEYAKLNVANYPTSSHALSSLAKLELEMGDRQNARRHYRDAIRLNPDNGGARTALESLGRRNTSGPGGQRADQACP